MQKEPRKEAGTACEASAFHAESKSEDNEVLRTIYSNSHVRLR